ncbi:MAG: hypothetical protein LBK24_03445 [Puniceicoccales bacterium]|nr:hypothetical protein [Puniceicoccales bacterium]
MMNSSATFPLFGLSDEDETPANLLKRARANAKEENVSLPKYLMGMLWHAIHGHDLSKIHIYQDGSGDTYDVEEVRRTHEEALAESAAGLTTVCKTKEELFAHLEKLEAAVDAGKEID